MRVKTGFRQNHYPDITPVGDIGIVILALPLFKSPLFIRKMP